jgi:hypothetical protein
MARIDPPIGVISFNEGKELTITFWETDDYNNGYVMIPGTVRVVEITESGVFTIGQPYKEVATKITRSGERYNLDDTIERIVKWLNSIPGRNPAVPVKVKERFVYLLSTSHIV